MSMQPTLKTERLLLRPFDRGDLQELVCLANDPEIARRTASIPHPYEYDHAEAWVSQHPQYFHNNRHAIFAIELHQEALLVGAVSLENICFRHQQADLGYWIGRKYWNQGIATEAAQVIIQYGFEEYVLHRIQAEHLAGNDSSKRVLEKLGMKPEGVLRDAFQKWSVFYNLHVYGLLRSEWLQS